MLRNTALLIAGLAGAFVFSQAPEFSQQYRQRIGGAVSEMRRVVADFDQDASRYGLSREEALQRYAGANDAFIVTRGVSIRRALGRLVYLQQQQAQIESTSPIMWPAIVARNADKGVVTETWEAFRPAMPVTPEGGVYGVLGFFTARGLFGLLLSVFGLGARRRRDA